MIKYVLRTIVILIIGICIGTTLLFGVAAIPNGSIKDNLIESKTVMFNEGYVYNPGIYNKGGRIDNFTDSIILFACVNDRNSSIFEHSMSVKVIKQNPIYGLNCFLEGKKVSTEEYARYWHGYQVILKPLLTVFNYSQMRYLNFFVQLLIVASISALMLKKKMFGYLVGYIITYLSISPLAIGWSLQLSPVFYITNIAILILFLFPEKIKDNSLYYFLVIGMATSYFDLLTYPLFTLGLPLIFILEFKGNDKWHIKDAFLNCLMWGIGYAGMWIGKWIVGSLILNRNVLENAVGAASYRVGDKNGQYDIFLSAVFTDCFDQIAVWYILMCIIVAFIPVALVERRFGLKKKFLLLISLLPFVWAVVIKNHTYVHDWFTYRIFGICILCFVSFILYNIYNYIVQERLEKKKLNNL